MTLQVDPWPAAQTIVSQAAQVADPVTFVKVPALQALHDEDPTVEIVPTGHIEHDIADADENDPAPHA